ncbi:MAG: hypothetical protein K2V38_08405 [Gemmataceae bacterium]|nr:hypothetical protein [Gemmataceae bacterium]
MNRLWFSVALACVALKKAKALKPGQKVKALGSFATYKGDKTPSLDQVMFKGQ